MRKRSTIKPPTTHQHLWLPMFAYHTENGDSYTRYQCKICSETTDKKVTSADLKNDQNGM